MIILATRETLVEVLRSYGEEAAAVQVSELDSQQINTICKRAGWFVLNTPSGRKNGGSISIDMALALAALEVLEGTSRPLKWKRRKLNKKGET